MNVTFTEEDVIAMQADLATVREHVHKLILAGNIVASHRITQLHGLRVQEKLAACRRKKCI